jgi:hypothetical protein
MSPLSEAGFGPRRTETLAGHLTAGIRSDLVMVNDCGLGADERLVRHRRRLSSHPIHARTSTPGAVGERQARTDGRLLDVARRRNDQEEASAERSAQHTGDSSGQGRV